MNKLLAVVCCSFLITSCGGDGDRNSSVIVENDAETNISSDTNTDSSTMDSNANTSSVTNSDSTSNTNTDTTINGDASTAITTLSCISNNFAINSPILNSASDVLNGVEIITETFIENGVQTITVIENGVVISNISTCQDGSNSSAVEGGDSDNIPDLATGTDVGVVGGNTAGLVELGPVKDARVSVQALDGFVFYETITDETGKFVVNVDSVKSAINAYGSEIEYVKIISLGGIDTDPNDDGVIIESEQISVLGTIEGVIPLTTLFESSDYRINFISTAVVSILDEIGEITPEQVSYIAERLGVPDINNDGVVDIHDLTAYRILDNNSGAESILREGFLEYVHNGNEESKKLFIDNLKYEIGFSRPLITFNTDNSVRVNLSKNGINNTIYYGIANDERRPQYVQYSGEELNLSSNDAVFYQECTDDLGCYKLQKLFFRNGKSYADYDFEYIQDNYAQLEEAASNVVLTQENFNQLVEQEDELKDEIGSIKDKIRELESQLN